MKEDFKHLEQAIWGLENKFPDYSLRLFLEKRKKFSLYFFLISLCFLAILVPQPLCLAFFFILNFLYFIVQIFKLFLVITGMYFPIKEEPLLLEAQALPLYTILLPIYKEDKILAELVQAIDNIDYPKNLLEVKLLLEEDDIKTLEAIERINLPPYFEVIKLPVSFPRTKPKACNYGLQFAKGKYIVVYDAEDRPDKLQLRQAVAKFAASGPEIICLQARLNYYNRQENLLTKLFSIEYAILFDYMLIGLRKWGIPIPLGGTSNHFIREKLNELGGWDAFNVTEDADLGVRLHQHGYRTRLLNSLTLEEAPISINAWLKQRARWIKGHILTSMLHLKTGNNLKLKEMLGLHLFLSLPNLIYLLLPFYLILRLFNIEDGQYSSIWLTNLLLGVITPIFYSLLIIITKKWYDLKSSILLAVFYYFLLPIAGFRAFWQILKSPFYWDKTEHGVSKYKL